MVRCLNTSVACIIVRCRISVVMKNAKQEGHNLFDCISESVKTVHGNVSI